MGAERTAAEQKRAKKCSAARASPARRARVAAGGTMKLEQTCRRACSARCAPRLSGSSFLNLLLSRARLTAERTAAEEQRLRAFRAAAASSSCRYPVTAPPGAKGARCDRLVP